MHLELISIYSYVKHARECKTVRRNALENRVNQYGRTETKSSLATLINLQSKPMPFDAPGLFVHKSPEFHRSATNSIPRSNFGPRHPRPQSKGKKRFISSAIKFNESSSLLRRRPRLWC